MIILYMNFRTKIVFSDLMQHFINFQTKRSDRPFIIVMRQYLSLQLRVNNHYCQNTNLSMSNGQHKSVRCQILEFGICNLKSLTGSLCVKHAHCVCVSWSRQSKYASYMRSSAFLLQELFFFVPFQCIVGQSFHVISPLLFCLAILQQGCYVFSTPSCQKNQQQYDLTRVLYHNFPPNR